MKTHKFVVTVNTNLTKGRARAAVLLAMSVRQPDGCEFHVKEYRRAPRPRR